MPKTEPEEPERPRRRTVRSSRRAGTSSHSFTDWIHSHRTGDAGRFWRQYVPLAEVSDREDVRSHKGTTVIGGTGGLLVTGLASAMGGTFAGGLTALGGAVIIKALSSRERRGHGTALAAGFLVGGLVAVILNAISGGSLTGTAKLGATLPNLKRLASRVKFQGLGAVGEATAVGLLGREAVRIGQLPALRRLRLMSGVGQSNLTSEFGRTFGLGRGLGVWNPVLEADVGGLGSGPGPMFEREIGTRRGWRQTGTGPTPPGTGLQPATYSGLRGEAPKAARGLGSLLDDLLGNPGGSGSTVSPSDSTSQVLQPAGAPRFTTIQNGSAAGWTVPAPVN